MGQGHYVGILYGFCPEQGDLSLPEARARWAVLMDLLLAWDEGRPPDEQTQCAHESEPYIGFWIAIGDRALADAHRVPWFGACAVPVSEVAKRFRERFERTAVLWADFERLGRSRGLALPAPVALLVADFD